MLVMKKRCKPHLSSLEFPSSKLNGLEKIISYILTIVEFKLKFLFPTATEITELFVVKSLK